MNSSDSSVLREAFRCPATLPKLVAPESFCYAFLNEADPGDEEFLFKSRKGVNRPITKSYVNQRVKEWTAGMNGNYGTHSMRKTFGYIQRKEFGVGFEVLCKRFGHSNPSVTMRYLGISDKEVNGILLNEI